jgi:hypothetical protein
MAVYEDAVILKLTYVIFGVEKIYKNISKKATFFVKKRPQKGKMNKIK